MPIVVAIMAETNAIAERPGPYPVGTLLVVRSTGKLMYWNAGTWLLAQI